MLCHEEIQQQLPLGVLEEGLGGNPNLSQKSKPLEKTSRSPALEKRRLYQQKYRHTHPEIVNACYRRYHEKHRDKLRAKRLTPEHRKRMARNLRNWLHRNPHKIIEKRKATIAYHKNRAKRDPLFALAHRLRKNIQCAFRRNYKRKSGQTLALLGCSIEEAKSHLAKQMVNGMSWDDSTSYQLDHIVPVSAFDLGNAEEVLWAFNWRNLQPLTPEANMQKHATIPNPLPTWLPAHIAERINSRRPAHRIASPS